MKSVKRRLDRLQRSLSDKDEHDPAAEEALRQLTDDELHRLRDALKRGFDPRQPDDVSLSSAEQAAYARFHELYVEAFGEPYSGLQ